MNKILKKILIMIIVVCLCGCTTVSNFADNNSYNKIYNLEKATTKDFVNVLRNYHVRNKNIKKEQVNEEFEDFLHEVVIDLYKDSYLLVHYDFVDYRSFGIEKPEVSWGKIEDDKETRIKESIDLLNRLQEFNYDSLSYRQQYDYEVLEYSLYENLSSLSLDFDGVLLFNSRTNFLSNVIENLSDFVFYDKESLDDYMILLADTDRYFKDAIEYTNKIANENNYYLIDASIDITEEYIDSFLAANPNGLITSFNERINEIDFIDSNAKAQYIKQNKKIINEEIIPEIKNIKDTIETHRGKTTTEKNRLINLSENLAEVSFLIDTSSNNNMDELFERACYVLRCLVSEIIPLLDDEIVDTDLNRIANGEVEPLNKSYSEMLEFLQENYVKTNPDVGFIDYELSAIDANSASESVAAYYWPSPIDKPEQNIIKYNPNKNETDELWSAYFIVAHEGIPGHMYDNYRSLLNNNNAIRRAISFIGVTEGYAMYSEMCASTYLDVDENTQKYLAINEVSGYILDAIIDIAINYYNYSDEELEELIESVGYSVGNIEYFKDFFADEYGLLTRYGIGLANVLFLKMEVQEVLGDKYDEIEFNDLLTRFGLIPFVILEDEVDKYINTKLNSK